MNDLEMLMPLAVKRLWACSYFIDERGTVTFDIDGLESFMRSGCRMGARGQNSDYTLFYVASSLEEANAAGDTLLAHMRKNARARGKRGPRTLEDKLARWSRMCSARRTRAASQVA